MATKAQTLPPPPTSPAPTNQYEYDAQGHPTKTVQAPGITGFNFPTQASYDRLGRLKDSTDAKSGVTAWGYDGREDVVQVTDPRKLVTQYPRNGLGDATSLVSPDTGTATQTFDAAGNLKTRTDSRGVVATYSYDALNRLTSIVYSKTGFASLTQGWVFDQTGTGFSNGVGRLTTSTHPGGSSQYTYDPQGRLLSETQKVLATAGANAADITTKVAYGYDTAGHVTSMTYPSGRKLTVTYSGGKPSALALAKDAGSTAVPLITSIQWEPFGGVSSWQFQMATGTLPYARVYDTYGRLVRYRLTSSVVRDITYDAADRITSYTHYDSTTAAALPKFNQSFHYDELGRLLQVTLYAGSWSFSYDANGNRTSTTINGVTSTLGISSTSNRIASISSPTRSFSYDSAGNTTTDGFFTATYDLAGRMNALTKAGVTASYSVDAFGRRVRKFTSAGTSTTVIFVYDPAGHLLGEYSNTGAAIREYVWLGDTPIAVFIPDVVATNPPLVYYIYADHLEAPRIVVDKSNGIRWRWLAEPFGVAAAESNPAGLGAFAFNLRLPGQYFDQESGLHYNGFRDYDASNGRYVQSDPIGLEGGLNTYSYVFDDPVNDSDLLGLMGGGGYSAAHRGTIVEATSCSCDQALQACNRLADLYNPAIKLAGGLVSGGAGKLAGLSGTSVGIVGGASAGIAGDVLESVTGMNKTGILAGCQAGYKKCVARCQPCQ